MPLTGLTGEWSRGAEGSSSSTERVLGERTCGGKVNNCESFFQQGRNIIIDLLLFTCPAARLSLRGEAGYMGELVPGPPG